uniref:Uncharacterized protein n=1 Tax=Knipowitschia caucasica TaxID=637954 RepID=A0AAV2JPU0_KNICA
MTDGFILRDLLLSSQCAEEEEEERNIKSKRNKQVTRLGLTNTTLQRRGTDLIMEKVTTFGIDRITRDVEKESSGVGCGWGASNPAQEFELSERGFSVVDPGLCGFLSIPCGPLSRNTLDSTQRDQLESGRKPHTSRFLQQRGNR